MNKIFRVVKDKYVIITPLFLIIFIAQFEQYSQLTSSGTFGSALRLSIPILLAGLGGLFSYRNAWGFDSETTLIWSFI